MAFIILDNTSGNIFDIQNSRKSRDLEKYFKRYPRYERNNVKLISTDFFSGYIKIAENYLEMPILLLIGFILLRKYMLL